MTSCAPSIAVPKSRNSPTSTPSPSLRRTTTVKLPRRPWGCGVSSSSKNEGSIAGSDWGAGSARWPAPGEPSAARDRAGEEPELGEKPEPARAGPGAPAQREWAQEQAPAREPVSGKAAGAAGPRAAAGPAEAWGGLPGASGPKKPSGYPSGRARPAG